MRFHLIEEHSEIKSSYPLLKGDESAIKQGMYPTDIGEYKYHDRV
jgi:hypothetical protein